MSDTLVVSCARVVEHPEEPVTYLTCRPAGAATMLQFFACARYGKEVPFLRQLWEPIRLAANIVLGKEQLLGEMVVDGEGTHRALAEFFAERAGHSLEWRSEDDD